MLEQGLYVFANLEEANGDESERLREAFDCGFRLSIFSYSRQSGGEFVVTPGMDVHHQSSISARLPLCDLKPIYVKGGQGLLLDCQKIVFEIVLSDESDRDILLNGLNAIQSAAFSM